MSLQLSPSPQQITAGYGPQISLSSSFIASGLIPGSGGTRMGTAHRGGAGYYSSIGGGAAPFAPILNMDSLENGALLKSCIRHIHRTNKKERKLTEQQNKGKASRNGHAFYQHDGSRAGKLYCRSGHHLQIHADGKVNGTRQEHNRFGVLEFLSVAFGLVSIKGKESGRYLCMNRRGRLYGSTKHTGECIFMERMLENYYNTYTSCRYGRGRNSKKKWYVALNKRGRPKRGNQSRKKHKFTQFLVLHLDDEDYKWAKRKFVLPAFTPDWHQKATPWERVGSSPRTQSQSASPFRTSSPSSISTIPYKNVSRLIQAPNRQRQKRTANNSVARLWN